EAEKLAVQAYRADVRREGVDSLCARAGVRRGPDRSQAARLRVRRGIEGAADDGRRAGLSRLLAEGPCNRRRLEEGPARRARAENTCAASGRGNGRRSHANRRAGRQGRGQRGVAVLDARSTREIFRETPCGSYELRIPAR